MSNQPKPLQYNIYKGISGKYGAIQFRLNLPCLICSKCKERFSLEDFSNTKFEYRVCSKCNGQLEEKEGCIFLDCAPASGKQVYDWKENKICMALSIKDIGQLLAGIEAAKALENIDQLLARGKAAKPEDTSKASRSENKISIMHDPGAGSDKKGQVTKNLTLSFPKGPSEGGIINVYQSTKEGSKKQCQIPLMKDELFVLMTLLTAAIPRLLNWN